MLNHRYKIKKFYSEKPTANFISTTTESGQFYKVVTVIEQNHNAVEKYQEWK